MLRWAQHHAAEQGKTLAEVVVEALQTYRAVVRARRVGAQKEESGEEAKTVELQPGQEIDAAWLQQTLGLAPATARKKLQRWAQRGVLQRVRRGKYVVVGEVVEG